MVCEILLFYNFYMTWLVTKNLANADVYKVFQAPRVGLEPTTPRLTAACSTIELSRITSSFFSSDIFYAFLRFHIPSKLYTELSLPHLGFLLVFSVLLSPMTLGQALDRLVAVSSIHYCTSTSALSTSSSSRGLTSFEWDISSWGGLHA